MLWHQRALMRNGWMDGCSSTATQSPLQNHCITLLYCIISYQLPQESPHFLCATQLMPIKQHCTTVVVIASFYAPLHHPFISCMSSLFWPVPCSVLTSFCLLSIELHFPFDFAHFWVRFEKTELIFIDTNIATCVFGEI